MPPILVKRNKVLKLSNVLSTVINLGEVEPIETIVEKMNSYIKVKGFEQIGPLIQYTNTIYNEDRTEIKVSLMLQCSNYIVSVEKPYRMDSVKKITNCLYTRYIGQESTLGIAYDKLRVEAYENDIILKGDCYTVFVERNEKEGIVIVDIFMECV